MKSIKYLVLACVLILSFIQCKSTKSLQTNPAIDELKTIMTGSFSSIEQSQTDSTYYNISLHMYPIWTASDKHYLYVEQALFSKQESPYRQRVYELIQVENGVIESKVYTLENEKDFVNKWSSPEFFEDFDDSLLREREGCSVFLKRISANHYEGSTDGVSCLSSLRGAAYASSVVSIKTNLISSWDQGFDLKGEQVWGATEGPYIFKRLD